MRRASSAMHLEPLAEFTVPARENPKVRFAARLEPRNPAIDLPPWRRDLGRPAFLVAAGVPRLFTARYTLFLDGVDTGIRLKEDTYYARSHFLTDTADDWVLGLESSGGFAGGWAGQLEKLQAGSTLLLVARDDQGEVGRYTFDIRNLRNAPAAVDASKGECQPGR
jgi:hypothetical protein